METCRKRYLERKRDYRRNLLMGILLNVQYMYMKHNPVRLNLIITGYSFNYSYVSVLQLIAKNIHDLQRHYCYYSYMVLTLPFELLYTIVTWCLHFLSN